MESGHDYKTGTETVFGGWGALMDIGKAWDSFDKNRRPRCFNCNIYGHLAKECRKLRKNKEIRKCYKCDKVEHCHMQVHLSGNNVPAVEPPPNHTSLPSIAATFLAIHLIAVLQPSGYSVFHGRDTPVQLGLPWWSYSCQCLNTETSAWGNRGFTTETLSIS